jgi:N-acetyl-alpha-D-glucosaminyl L-malate synthase BshA
VSTEPLRVGVVSFSSLGGSGVVASGIGMALGRRGHRVCFISDKPPPRLDLGSPNVSFHAVATLDFPPLAQRSYALALAALLIDVAQRERLRILHAHYAIPHSISANLVRQILGREAPKVVTTLHGTDVTLVGSGDGFRPITRFAVAASDAVTTPSRWLAETARTSLQLPDELRIDVIANFVDTARFSPAPRPALARPGGDPDRPPVLAHVSNFRPLKCVDDVVRIFAAVRSQIPVRLELVGDGPERPRIEAIVQELGLEHEVGFHDEIAENDLARFYRGVDVFLLPSAQESFGLAALEAMACGVPVVASAVGGLPDVVADGETGFLAPAGDVSAMAAKVRCLLADPHLHAAMSVRASLRAKNAFGVIPAVEAYEEVYRRVLE